MTERKIEQNQEVTEINTFPVPFDLGKIQDNFIIATNTPSKPSKEQIINQAYKFHSQGNIPKAAEYYKYFINQGFNDYGVLNNYGSILQDLGNLKEAETSYRKAIELNPNLADAHSNLGSILIDLGNLKEAETSYRKAIELNPNLADAHSNLAIILIDLGNLKEAELPIRKAIELKPNYADFHSVLGFILIELRKLQEAELSIRQAIELDPKSAKYKLYLGICQFALGDINSSLETLELAYIIDPNDQLINTLRAILKGRKRIKPKNLRVENIIDSLYKEESSWNPIVLNRSVEKELIKTLYTLKTEGYSRPIYGNIKGSDYSLFEKDIPIIRDFREDLIKILSDYFESEIYIKSSFFNIISPKDGVGGGNTIHNHLGRIDKISQLNILKQKLSLVYYLSIGDRNGTDPGILKFHEPTKDFLPEKGMIVIFPASRLHSVYYNGKKDRVVLSVNFYLI